MSKNNKSRVIYRKTLNNYNIMILKFEDWNKVNEAESLVNEAAGISSAIRGHLIDFLKKNKEASYDEACEFIASKVKGWELSKEDFEEAKSLDESNNTIVLEASATDSTAPSENVFGY
jgi:hypothetical protein